MRLWPRRCLHVAKKGLGKGLSALIPEKELPSGAEVIQVPLEKIRRNPDQPRKAFRKESLEELAASIREHGVIQPLLLMPDGEGYILVAGERRLRASQLAGLSTVPAILRKMGQEDSAALAIIENIQRENLTPLEESQAYQRLIQLHGMTQERLGETLGKSRSYITNSLRLLQLPESIRNAIDQSLLSPSHGRSIPGVCDPCPGLSTASTSPMIPTVQARAASTRAQRLPRQRWRFPQKCALAYAGAPFPAVSASRPTASAVCNTYPSRASVGSQPTTCEIRRSRYRTVLG